MAVQRFKFYMKPGLKCHEEVSICSANSIQVINCHKSKFSANASSVRISEKGTERIEGAEIPQDRNYAQSAIISQSAIIETTAAGKQARKQITVAI
jgi:ribosomal protein S8E